MDIPLWKTIIIQLALVAVNALYSMADVAVGNLNENKLQKQADDGSARAWFALKVRGRASILATTVQIANTFLGLLIAAEGAANYTAPLSAFFARLPGIGALPMYALEDITVILMTLITCCVIMVLGLYLPRRLSLKYMKSSPRPLLRLIYVTSYILAPMRRIMNAVTDALLRAAKINPEENQRQVTEEEILAMVDIGEEKGAIEKNEKDMIENIFEFNNMTAEDCMTHRTDVFAFPIDAGSDEIYSTIEETGRSRFPIYGKDIDDILGVLTTRDFLLNERRDPPLPLNELLRPAYFVPESARSDLLFREMQNRKTHMAIVVDEYGGTSGLVTMEDLLEEIVGNIYDEFDPLAEQDITVLPDGRFRVSGHTDLEALSEALGIDIEEDEQYDTVGGMIFAQLSTIPDDGTRPTIECDDMIFEVEEIADHRIEWVLVTKKADGEPDEGRADEE